MLSKMQIRNTMKKRRSELSPAEVRTRSEHIIARLTALEIYHRAGCMGSYVSVKNEVDTCTLIDSALDSGKRVAVPVAKQSHMLIHKEIRTLADLKPSVLGLLEPVGEAGTEVSPDTLDLVLVPGLAFDHAGNRIGFGVGYYDRFLSLTPAFKIGLAYDFQIFDRLPTDPCDISLDLIISESDIHTVRQA